MRQALLSFVFGPSSRGRRAETQSAGRHRPFLQPPAEFATLLEVKSPLKSRWRPRGNGCGVRQRRNGYSDEWQRVIALGPPAEKARQEFVRKESRRKFHRIAWRGMSLSKCLDGLLARAEWPRPFLGSLRSLLFSRNPSLAPANPELRDFGYLRIRPNALRTLSIGRRVAMRRQPDTVEVAWQPLSLLFFGGFRPTAATSLANLKESTRTASGCVGNSYGANVDVPHAFTTVRLLGSGCDGDSFR